MASTSLFAPAPTVQDQAGSASAADNESLEAHETQLTLEYERALSLSRFGKPEQATVSWLTLHRDQARRHHCLITNNLASILLSYGQSRRLRQSRQRMCTGKATL